MCIRDSCLIARLSKQSKHVLLISFHARLIEGIHAQNVTAYAYRKFEEIEELAQAVLVLAGNIDTKIRNISCLLYTSRWV